MKKDKRKNLKRNLIILIIFFALLFCGFFGVFEMIPDLIERSFHKNDCCSCCPNAGPGEGCIDLCCPCK